MSEIPKAKILVVDDHDDNLFVMKHCLKNIGAEICTAKSGPEALELAEKYEFALVYMDVQMPGMDGFETTRRMLKTEKNKNSPIIFITSISREEDNIRRGYEAGAVDFMFKPFILEVVQGKASIFLSMYARQQELKLLRNKAEQANRDKSNFIATVSHEIRTPMNGVLGMNQLLLDTPLNEEQKDCVNTAIDSAKSLLRLIDEILDFSKIEAGKLELESIPYEIRKVFESVGGMLTVIAKTKGIELRVNIDKDVPQFIQGDPYRLRQVLTNLANNSIKFTKVGRVELNLSRHLEGLVVSIKDTGVGIEAEKLHRLFGAYSQTDASITRRFGGTGLGLVISKCIVEAFGGRIEVQSEVGVGSCFSFDLPKCLMSEDELKAHGAKALTEAQQEDHAKKSALNSDWKQHKLEILLVEDNMVNQKVASKLLMSIGFRCDIANNGREAIEAVRAKEYQLVFMDCQMPILNGYDATREIRQFKTREQLSIVAMTANVIKEEQDACISAGMNGFVAKPINRKELEAVVRETVEERAKGEKTV